MVNWENPWCSTRLYLCCSVPCWPVTRPWSGERCCCERRLSLQRGDFLAIFHHAHITGGLSFLPAMKVSRHLLLERTSPFFSVHLIHLHCDAILTAGGDASDMWLSRSSQVISKCLDNHGRKKKDNTDKGNSFLRVTEMLRTRNRTICVSILIRDIQ